jgi:hypothetical protein
MRRRLKMKDLYMKLLYFLADKAEINGLSLYKGGSYSDIEFKYEGKQYKISLKDEERE